MGETLVDVPVSDEARGRADDMRPNQGIYRHLILAAAYFADRARGVEIGVARSGIAELSTAPESVRHRAYVMGAILSAAAFLEASINELYLELCAARRGDGARKRQAAQTTEGAAKARLPKRVLAALGRAWSDIRRTRVLPRYQVVLKVADAERFDERRPPFSDAETLFTLRDALLHTRPERTISRRRYRSLEKRLRGQFAASPFATSDSQWFPEQCLGAGCAEWAVRVANEFSNDFCRRIALPARGLARSEVEGRRAPPGSELAHAEGRGAAGERMAPNELTVSPPGNGS